MAEAYSLHTLFRAVYDDVNGAIRVRFSGGGGGAAYSIHTVARAVYDSVNGAVHVTAPDFAGAGASGLVPDPGSETGKYLKDDGTWATPAGGGGGYSVYVEEADVAVGDNSAADITLDFDGTDFNTSIAAQEIEITIEDSGIDHGSVGGLTDDDHTQYMLVDGTRAYTAYMDLPEIAAPAAPAADHMRLFVEDVHGFSFYSFRDAGGMTRKIVRDSVFVAYNDSGSTIAASRIVYASGATADVPTIALAKADSLTTMPAIGVTIETIANGAYGRIMQVGLLEDVNTSGYSSGDTLYVSAATGGIPTVTPPTYPNVRQEIGTILVSDAAVGSIQIVARSVLDETIIDHAGLLNTHNLTTDIDHDALTNFAANEHFTEASIDHTNILNIGTNAHSVIDTHIADGHIADGTKHFLEGAIDHTSILNIGTKSHATLDTEVTANTAAQHARSHAVTGTSDHTAGNHKILYSDGSGNIQELTHGSSGQVLTANGATSAPSWQAGGAQIAFFQARRTAGGNINGDTAGTAWGDVIFNVQDFADAGFTYSTATGQLTIGAGLAGRKGVFSVGVNTAAGGTDRVELIIELQENTGESWTTVVFASNYSQRDTDQNTGGVWIANYMITLSSSYLYKIRQTADWDAGTPTFATNGCYWSVMAIG
jgi:hypothetical protein